MLWIALLPFPITIVCMLLAHARYPNKHSTKNKVTSCRVHFLKSFNSRLPSQYLNTALYISVLILDLKSTSFKHSSFTPLVCLLIPITIDHIGKTVRPKGQGNIKLKAGHTNTYFIRNRTAWVKHTLCHCPNLELKESSTYKHSNFPIKNVCISVLFCSIQPLYLL